VKRTLLSVSFVLLASVALIGRAEVSGDKKTKTSAETSGAPRAFGGMITGVDRLAVTVENVDTGARDVTLQGPEGKTLTFVAGKELRNFTQIKAGDPVYLEITQAVAIAVTK